MIDERFPNWDVDVEKGEIYSLYYKRYVGSIDKNGYVHVSKQKGYKHLGLHQYIWMVANGCDIPDGYDIHHIDGNKLNNSIYNLELVEHKNHMSEHKMGKHRSEETKKKISESHKGKIISEETKNKMSNAHVNNTKLSKKVTQYTLEGELVKIWDSIMEAERNGYHQGHISACCQGKKKTHKGFIWKYYNEEKDAA